MTVSVYIWENNIMRDVHVPLERARQVTGESSLKPIPIVTDACPAYPECNFGDY
jgi:hypothetical protein